MKSGIESIRILDNEGIGLQMKNYMRLFTIALTMLMTPTVYAQTRLFDLTTQDSINFTQFAADKKVIVIGELHGTTEIPLVVLRLIRQLRTIQKELAVGLEISSTYQKDIDKYLKTGDFDKLLNLEHFKYPDGRSSVAMGQLIRGLRKMKSLRVVCFDVDTSFHGTTATRDSLMGLNLVNAYEGGQMVILTGNLHANLKEGYWRPNFKSALFHFNKAENFGEELLSLNTYFGSGTIWNCMQDGCKERDAGYNSSLKQKYGLTNFIAIGEGRDSTGYDGFVYFDKVTASKPLVDQATQ